MSEDRRKGLYNYRITLSVRLQFSIDEAIYNLNPTVACAQTFL